MSTEDSSQMAAVVLVACCGKKRAGNHPARDLYQSQLFRKARAYAERQGGDWFILSAKHGVVAPNQPIDAYDLTLATMPRSDRADWAARVGEQLAPYAARRIVILAGNRYCENWIGRFPLAERPMKGMGIGQQLAWLSHAGSTF